MGERGPAPGPVGAIGEALYRVVVRARNRSFDRGRRVTRLGVPVISVGNLSVGGTGKTPMVARVVELLQESGHSPAIAMRGYGSARGGVSDEQAEHAERLGGVPIVAQPNRVEGVRALLESGADVDCVVLDDGFQHRFVARDLEIVLIDATRNPFEGHCLPRGWLREPVESLARADAVVLTRSDQVGEGELGEIEAGVARVAPSAVVARGVHAWEWLETPSGREAVGWLEGRRVVAACAIGNPEAFVGAVARSGAEVVGKALERDHHAWGQGDVAAIARDVRGGGAEAVVTTEKDWVKLRGLDLSSLGVPVVRPRLRLDILEGWPRLAELIRAVARGAGASGVSGG